MIYTLMLMVWISAQLGQTGWGSTPVPVFFSKWEILIYDLQSIREILFLLKLTPIIIRKWLYSIRAKAERLTFGICELSDMKA
ncbi:hypothetical protein GCM10011339_11820 [Echinicola rosea]|uniref:Uncharacterized protein n=1 Tax=Echinicola rosea TaxID=1807691 RepID=A0ABQ1URY5_9BACT|nr:hypothetical protein GCM10011339_11820 [Echinicola rosea]